MLVGIILLSMSLAFMEKNLLKASDIVLGLVSIWLLIFRDAICLFDLVFILIRDLTASQVCLEFVLFSLKKCFVVLRFINSSKSIDHAFVSLEF